MLTIPAAPSVYTAHWHYRTLVLSVYIGCNGTRVMYAPYIDCERSTRLCGTRSVMGRLEATPFYIASDMQGMMWGEPELEND